MTGYEAMVEGAVVSGCRAICGQRATPPEEIFKAAGVWMPRVGGNVHQPRSEAAAIETVYNLASQGARVLFTTCGIESEVLFGGIARLAAAEIPCVIAYTPRPSWICSLQGKEDQDQILRGTCPQGFRYVVLAPNGVQEVTDLTVRAFDLADRYKNPVVLVIDEVLGQTSEPAFLPEGSPVRLDLPARDWVSTTPHGGNEEKYEDLERRDSSWEIFGSDNANTLVVAYGFTSRAARAAVVLASDRGIRARMFRPVSLSPFPSAPLNELSKTCTSILVVELGRGQLLRTVLSSVGVAVPISHISAEEGEAPKALDILAVLGRAGLRYAS
jgi:2-oxoglutarate ferredoxin oxidoreductase subunit alpha